MLPLTDLLELYNDYNYDITLIRVHSDYLIWCYHLLQSVCATVKLNLLILLFNVTHGEYRIAQNFDSGKVRRNLTNQTCQKV